MNFNTVKGYILIVLSSLVMVLAVLITILQGGLRAEFSVFGWPEDRSINTGLLMLFSAVGGIIVYLCMNLLFSGIGSVRKGKEEALRRIATKLSDLGK
jgi:uncharacterized integral membrane protein